MASEKKNPLAAYFRSANIVKVTVPLILCLATLGVLLTLFATSEIARQRKMTCMDNLHQIGIALQSYIADNDGDWPVYSAWTERRISPRPLAGCPSARPITEKVGKTPGSGGIAGYGYNSSLSGDGRDYGTAVKGAEVIYPATTVAVCDAPIGFSVNSEPNPFSSLGRNLPSELERSWERHEGGANYLFCDGHAAPHKIRDFIRPGTGSYPDPSPGNTGVFPSFFLTPPPPPGSSPSV